MPKFSKYKLRRPSSISLANTHSCPSPFRATWNPPRLENKSTNRIMPVSKLHGLSRRILLRSIATARGFFLMSDSQSLTTCQPDFLSRVVISSSRFMFLEILAHQYAAFVPLDKFLRKTFHFRPCQKSPSQKTAT